jgi:hypothetical protein
MSPASRRTIRMSDEEWAAGHAKAKANGETLTEVLRRLLAGYLIGNAQGLVGYDVEYRATPKGNSLTAEQRAEFTVDHITGRYEDVRRLYPAKYWMLEERTVSAYTPAARKSVSKPVQQNVAD